MVLMFDPMLLFMLAQMEKTAFGNEIGKFTST
jgi:hypothetical protein